MARLCPRVPDYFARAAQWQICLVSRKSTHSKMCAPMTANLRKVSALIAATALLCASAAAKDKKSNDKSDDTLRRKVLAGKIESILSAPDISGAFWGIQV